MNDRLTQVTLDLADVVPSPQMAQEQKLAIYDLVEDNRFSLPDIAGPYALTLSCEGARLRFNLTASRGKSADFSLTLGELRQVIRDYAQICDGYYDAVKTAATRDIEALDDARRAIHSEGAALLRTRLADKAEVDAATSRRLFTLVCVLLSQD